MICANCQNELKPDAKFCGTCGTPVDSAAAEMTVILPKVSTASAHVTEVPPVDAQEEGATVILPKSHSTQAPAPRTDVPVPAVHLSESSLPAEEPVRMPPLSLAMEFEQQFGSAEEIEKKGRTVVAAIFAAAAVLVVIAIAAWWSLTKTSAPVEPAPVEASAPEPTGSAPAVAPLVEASAATLVTPQAVVPAPTVSEPVAAASKPAVQTERKLSEEEEYLRQIRRQLNQQR